MPPDYDSQHVPRPRARMQVFSFLDTLSELISGHEEVIEARKRLVLDHLEPPVPEHRALSPEDYREFFNQAKAIKWLKL